MSIENQTLNKDLEAEMSVLGSILISPELYAEAARFIETGDFIHSFHKKLFYKMGELYAKTGTIDLIMLLENLSAIDETERREQKEYMMKLSDSVPIIQNLKYYCEYVKKRSIGRKALEILSEADFRGITGADIAETVQSAAEKLAELVRVQGGRTTRPAQEVLQDIYRDVFEETEDLSISTGFWTLDKMLDGIEPGDFVIIGAGTSVGKTAFMLQIIANMARKGKKILLYSLEMTDKQNMQRVISRLSGVEVGKLKRKDRTDTEEKEKIKEAILTAHNYIIEISDKGSLKIKDIRLDAIRHKDVDVIFIDHLGLMRGEKYNQNLTGERTEVLQGLRALALDLKKPIIGLAQFNRDAKPDVSKKGVVKYIEPQLHHFKDSSEYEQSGGTAILLWRMPGYDDVKSKNYHKIGVKVAKNRQGRTGKMYMEFEAATMNFKEVYDYNPPSEFEAADESLEEMGF